MTHPASEFPERDQRLGEIVFACLQTIENGQDLHCQELLKRHPEFATELAEFFADRDHVQRLASPVPGPAAAGPAGETRILGPSADLGEREDPLPPGTRIGYFGDYELLEEVG